MHRTQIYLHDSLHDTLKRRARLDRISMSELIRRTLENHVSADPASHARAYFEQLRPLPSLAQVEPEAYVQDLRGRSRLLREGGGR